MHDLPNPLHLRGWLRNVGCGYADTLVGGLVFLFLTPFLLQRLGSAAYALWVLAHTITFYLAFLDLGIGNAQVRFHARFAAGNRTRDVRATIATSCVSLLAAGAVAAIIACLIAFATPEAWLAVPAAQLADFRLVMLLLSVEMLVSFAGAGLENIYEGANRFDLRNLRSIALRVATALTQVIALLNGAALIEMVAIELAAAAVRLALDLVLTARLLPGWWRGTAQFHGTLWHRLRTFALWTSLDEALTEGGAQLDHLLIAAALPLVLLTPYSLCTGVAGLLLMAVRPIVETFFPIASAMHGRGGRTDVSRLLLMGSKAAMAIAAPLALLLGLFGHRVLELWVPEAAPGVPAGLMPVVVLDYMTSMYLWPATVILVAIGRTRLAAALTAAELATGVVLMLVLAPVIGLIGIAVASLIANVTLGLFIQLPLTARASGVSLPAFFASTLPRVSLALVPGFLAALVLRPFVESGGWPSLIATVIVVLALYGVCLLLFGVRQSDRAYYLRLLRQR